MRNSKSQGYINYGSTPRNEYNAANMKNDTSAVLDPDMQGDDTTQKQRPRKQRTQYPSGRGWARSAKANGWRAELASRQEESAGAGRYYNDGGGQSTPVYFIMTEMILFCIYKADTRKETLSNMQAARIYVDDPDMLAIFDSAANKLDNMTDAIFSGIIFDPTFLLNR